MYRNIISFLLVVGYGLYAHSQQLPLVYDQEHTGSHYAPPEMPGYDQLSECKEPTTIGSWKLCAPPSLVTASTACLTTTMSCVL